MLEVLLETCNVIIHSDAVDQEHWLAGLERVAKATVLGHLLPVLVTAMNHEKLRCLPMADELMPQLVQLVVLTSQVCHGEHLPFSRFLYFLNGLIYQIANLPLFVISIFPHQPSMSERTLTSFHNFHISIHPYLFTVIRFSTFIEVRKYLYLQKI